MKSFSYKGFKGSIKFSKEDDCFYGKLLNITDLVLYEGDTVEKLEESFRYMVESHIKLCNELENKNQAQTK